MKRAALFLAASLVVGSFMSSIRPAAAVTADTVWMQNDAQTLIRDGLVPDARAIGPGHPATRLEIAALTTRAAARVEAGAVEALTSADVAAIGRLSAALRDELDRLGSAAIDVAVLGRAVRGGTHLAPSAEPPSSAPYGLSIGMDDLLHGTPLAVPAPRALGIAGPSLDAAYVSPLTLGRPRLGALQSAFTPTVRPLGAALAPGLTVSYRSFFDGPVRPANAAAPVLPRAATAADVGERVFGVQMETPLANPLGFASPGGPALFARIASSAYGFGGRLDAPVVDTAGLVGLRLALGSVSASFQVQQAGPAFAEGTPLRLRDAPAWSLTSAAFAPDAFGYAHPAVPVRSVGAANFATQAFVYPVLNPFVSASGDDSVLTPNQRGLSATVTAPIQLGGLTVNARAFAQHLAEVRPGVPAPGALAEPVPATARATWDKLDVGGSFTIPVFRRPVAFALGGSFEHLKRNDKQGSIYVPYAPTTDFDPSVLTTAPSLAAPATGTNPTLPSTVRYYPNYVSAYHTLFTGGATVPVTRDVIVGLRYSGQQYYGAYGTTDAQNVLERNNQVDLSLTYRLPQSGNSVGVAFRNSTYKDSAVPTFNFQQNREDLNFTVRF